MALSMFHKRKSGEPATMTGFRDWENHYAYLTKKFHELSLDQLLEATGDSMHKEKRPLLRKLQSEDYHAAIDEEERKERLRVRVQEIYELLRDRKFFTDRQRQVLSLMFGWNGSNYVGPKTISDIAKLLGIAQPVAFNHLRLAVKKLKKHFGTAVKKTKGAKTQTRLELKTEDPLKSADASQALDID